jgi:predicted dehydrogenase
MRIAIIGCGSIGRRHLANLMHLGYRDLLACDPVAAARDSVAAEFGVPTYADPQAVWEQRPAVTLITSPSHCHVPLALQAAAVGSHLFIEKPVSHNLEQLDQLLHLAREQRITTLVGCNMRFHPGPAQVKAWLTDQAIGDVLGSRLQTGSYLPRWRPQSDYRQSYSASPAWGGAVLDCIHELDLALWLFGKARLVAAITRPATSLGLATDGLAEILLEHTGGVVSNVHLNFVQRNYRRSIQIIGSTGSIEWDWTAGRADLYGPTGEVSASTPQPANWSVNLMYLDELKHFLTCVQTGVSTVNPLDSAADTLRLALAARSMR